MTESERNQAESVAKILGKLYSTEYDIQKEVQEAMETLEEVIGLTRDETFPFFDLCFRKIWQANDLTRKALSELQPLWRGEKIDETGEQK
jgi:hypothetical protein